MAQSKFVVTGRTGIGKSTLLRGLALFAEDLGLSYFAIFTPEVREGKRRAGFAIESVTFDPQHLETPAQEGGSPAKIKRLVPFAHLIQQAGDTSPPVEHPNRVGRYTIDPSVVTDMIITPLQAILHARKIPLVFFDEVGLMYLKHAPFLDTLRNLLKAPVIAFISLTDGTDQAIRDEIRAHPSVETFALTIENRDALLNTFIAQLVDLSPE
jgi:nucleoside-triphosphatase THEP1